MHESRSQLILNLQNNMTCDQGRWQGVTPVTKLRGPRAWGAPEGAQGGPRGADKGFLKGLLGLCRGPSGNFFLALHWKEFLKYLKDIKIRGNYYCMTPISASRQPKIAFLYEFRFCLYDSPRGAPKGFLKGLLGLCRGPSGDLFLALHWKEFLKYLKDIKIRGSYHCMRPISASRQPKIAFLYEFRFCLLPKIAFLYELRFCLLFAISCWTSGFISKITNIKKYHFIANYKSWSW